MITYLTETDTVSIVGGTETRVSILEISDDGTIRVEISGDAVVEIEEARFAIVDDASCDQPHIVES